MRQRESCGEKEKRRERLSRRVWRTAKAAEVHQGVTTTNVHVVDGRASTTPERESERILEAAAVGPLVVLFTLNLSIQIIFLSYYSSLSLLSSPPFFLLPSPLLSFSPSFLFLSIVGVAA